MNRSEDETLQSGEHQIRQRVESGEVRVTTGSVAAGAHLEVDDGKAQSAETDHDAVAARSAGRWRRWFGRAKQILRLGRDVPFVPQMEVAECGAASLAMILAYHGRTVSLADLRHEMGVSRDGVDALSILETAERHGLEAQGVQIDLDDLHELELPAIAHWEFNHFLVLERLTPRGAIVVDPSHGRRFVSTAEINRAFTGVALELKPGSSFERVKGERLRFARYLGMMARFKHASLVILATTLMLECLAVATPMMFQVMVDHVIMPQRTAWHLPVLLLLGTLLIARQGLSLLRARLLSRLRFAIDLDLMTRFAAHLLRLPLTFFDQRGPGDLMQRVSANQTLREAIAHAMLGLMDGALLVSFAALMIAYNPPLGLVVLALMSLRTLLLLGLRQRTEQGSASRLAALSKEYSVVVDGVAAPESVRAFGAEPLLEQRHRNALVERLNRGFELKRLTHGYPAWLTVFDGVTQAVVLWIGGHAVLNDEMTAGTFTAFLVLAAMVQAPMASLLAAYGRIMETNGILARLDDVLMTKEASEGTHTLGHCCGELTLDRVHFRYGPTSPWVLQDINLQVAAGEKIAIVGRSGHGKSTLARLLMGLVQAEEGRVLVDGQALRALRTDEYLRHVGAVLQEPYLFNDTVRNNLALGRENVSMESLERAARRAAIHDVIQALPQGYQTVIGQGGNRLSGGERQRLCLARALVDEPAILILDEATSALDPESQAEIQAQLESLGATQIVIAHRLETVQSCDRIIVLHEGRVVQEGRFDTLRRQPGPFAQMMRELR